MRLPRRTAAGLVLCAMLGAAQSGDRPPGKRSGRGFIPPLPSAMRALGECRQLRHHGKRAEARACFERLAADPHPYIRAEAFWGLGQYQDANAQFSLAVARDQKNADCRVRWGRLFLERFNKAEAAKLLQEALELQKDHAGALLGLALVASDGFESKAVELAQRAVKSDPKLVEAQELLARLALEDSDPEHAAKEAGKALAISDEALEAMAIYGTIDWLAGKPSTAWLDRILKINPVYGEAYATAAHFFVLNRRYEEGIQFYRKALELDPDLWGARSELGINLMRLGQDDEARKQLEQCYDNGHRDAATVNSLRLLDSYKNFHFFRDDRTVLKLHKKEAPLLRPYFDDELKRAIATYEKKYRVKLEKPIQVEVYPDHEDFAVRTMGMPGLGALGVTFGYVVAMDSPSGRKPGRFHWASTLWHELSHVFVLTATHHRVPRWFTEGMAVHEETAVAPDWGDRLDPEIIVAIRDKKLLPVAKLDRGFVRPSFPAQVGVSYFQAGRMCDYIAREWGSDKLLAMMHSFAKLKSTPEVIREHLGISDEEFDQRFLAWLNAQTKKTVDGFDEWKKQIRHMAELAKAKSYAEVIREGVAIRDVYPEYVETGSVYEFLAEAHLAQNNKAEAMTELERYAKIGGREPALLRKLAGLQEESGKKKDAAETLNRINYVYPLDEELHPRLAGLWLELGNVDGAIREYQAALALRPLDPAASHFNLARAYRASNRIEEAREHLLLALEAAPSFKPAQKMLLELSK